MPIELNALLHSLGCQSPAETNARFLNDMEFYVEITSEMLRDSGFEALGEHLKAGDTQAAFDTAHMLKGIIGNCGITPLYELIVQIVEPLRGGNADFQELTQVYARLLRARDEASERLRQNAGACPSAE